MVLLGGDEVECMFLIFIIKGKVLRSFSEQLTLYFMEYFFPLTLQTRLMSGGLEPVIGETEEACISFNYRQFTTNIKIKI